MRNVARLLDLRRRVEREPGSIAFGKLADEQRRAGRHREAIATCRAGLERYPDYISARVTLGLALLDTGEIDQAEAELRRVLAVSSDNLAALKGLSEILCRRGMLRESLATLRRALEAAGRDPQIEQTIARLEEEVRAAEKDRKEGRRPKAALSGPTRVVSTEVHLLPALEGWLERILADRSERARSLSLS